MRIAPLFLTLLKRYLGLKHLLTCLLDLLVINEVLSGSISELRRLPSLSAIIELSLSYPALLLPRKYTTNNLYACLIVIFVLYIHVYHNTSIIFLSSFIMLNSCFAKVYSNKFTCAKQMHVPQDVHQKYSMYNVNDNS